MGNLRSVFGSVCYSHFRQFQGTQLYIVQDWDGIQTFCSQKFVHFFLICLSCLWKFDLPEEPLAVPTFLANFKSQPQTSSIRQLPVPTTIMGPPLQIPRLLNFCWTLILTFHPGFSFNQCAFTLVWSPYFFTKIFCPQTIAVAPEQFWPYLCKNVTSMSHVATLPDWSSDRYIQHEVEGWSPNSGLLSCFLVNIFNSHFLAHHTSVPLEIWFLVLSDM